MAMGYGLQGLLTSPLGQGQEQVPDPNDMVSQVMEQFTQWIRKRGTEAIPMGGRQGLQQPTQQSIQAPVGMPPREKAGNLRAATGEGAATFMQQAGETAAEPWKPQALDIALIAASVAGPIIAAMQPEGRGRRGQRKQQRMSGLFKGLGEIAQKGVGMRMGSFQQGKEATFGAAQDIAETSVDEAQAKYERKIAGIESAESTRRWEAGMGLAERGMAIKERPKAKKLTNFDRMTPEQQKAYLNKQAYGAPSKAGGLTENQREKSRQQDVLNRANAHLYSLDPKIKKRAKIDYDITSFAALAEAAQALAKHREPTGLFGWGEGEAAPDSTLYDLMIEYMGQGGGSTDSDTEARRLLEQLRREQGPIDSLIGR